MTNLRQLLGTNIKIRRKACGLSQSKLAELAETATNYISAIEAGRRFPSVEILERIALALKIDTPELFYTETVQLDKAKNEMEEQIWQEVGQHLSTFISKRMTVLTRSKQFCTDNDETS